LLEHDLGLVEAQLHFGTIFLKSLLSISFLTFRTLRYRICILSRIHISPVHGTQLWFIATNARFQRPQITQFYIFFLERLQIPFVGLPISFPQLNTDKRVTKPCLDFLQSKSMVFEANLGNVPLYCTCWTFIYSLYVCSSLFKKFGYTSLTLHLPGRVVLKSESIYC